MQYKTEVRDTKDGKASYGAAFVQMQNGEWFLIGHTRNYATYPAWCGRALRPKGLRERTAASTRRLARSPRSKPRPQARSAQLSAPASRSFEHLAPCPRPHRFHPPHFPLDGTRAEFYNDFNGTRLLISFGCSSSARLGTELEHASP